MRKSVTWAHNGVTQRTSAMDPTLRQNYCSCVSEIPIHGIEQLPASTTYLLSVDALSPNSAIESTMADE